MNKTEDISQNDFAISPEESEELLNLIADSMKCAPEVKSRFDTYLSNFTKLDVRAKQEEFDCWIEAMRNSLNGS
jgi:hypothetical protein